PPAPPGVEPRDSRHPDRVGSVFENALDVAVKSISLEAQRIDEKIRPAVVVVVGEVDTHAGIGAAVIVVADSRGEPHLCKTACTQIVEQLLLSGIVGHRDIHLAVAVVVADRNTKPLARGRAPSASGGRVFEGAVTA